MSDSDPAATFGDSFGPAAPQRHLEDPDQMLRLINEVLTMAPEFGDQNVTLPLGAILDWTMATPAGFAAFRDSKVDAALKKILTAWCDYLNSPESLYVLNDSPSGWTPDGRSASSSTSTTRTTRIGASRRGTSS
jgi:hypothetical protein